MQEILRMFTRILRNLLEDSEECYHFNIPVNVREDSSECSRLLGMLSKILENDQKNSEIIMTGNYIRKIRISHIS